ncbi:MAG TPA: hypothetical protein VM779_05650 [Thermoanaerobaculia bacterium]|nr:hypothetical protein [Thermoanaerobaculia bacterium]
MLFFTAGAIGQQETLLVDLRIEPARAARQVGLYDAATANNFYRFTALYAEAPQPEYAELHRLWTWSMEDPIGAFYGTEEYARLSARYPGYRAYIDSYRIIDSNGNTFYPTAETRRFLLAEAVIGTVPVRREAPLRIAVAAPAAAPVEIARVATPAPQAAPQPQIAAQPRIAPQPIAREPLEARVSSPAPPAIAQTVLPEAVRGVVRRNEADRGALSRSIFLMIAGLIGIGMLTLMLQAPGDEHERNLTSHAP